MAITISMKENEQYDTLKNIINNECAATRVGKLFYVVSKNGTVRMVTCYTEQVYLVDIVNGNCTVYEYDNEPYWVTTTLVRRITDAVITITIKE